MKERLSSYLTYLQLSESQLRMHNKGGQDLKKQATHSPCAGRNLKQAAVHQYLWPECCAQEERAWRCLIQLCLQLELS